MFQETFEKWRTDSYFDEQTRAELNELVDNPIEIEDRFYQNLEFGTGGLRGIIGAGTNRMNKYVIRQATQGLAEYISTFGDGAKKRGVVIAYDSRHFSQEFAFEAGSVLATNGIKAYVFESLRPTPELSFSVRELGAIAGIVVTASHNPPKYNGYKVYWEDGGQIPPERAKDILGLIEGVKDLTKITPIPLDAARGRGLLQEIGEEIDAKYLKRIKGLVLNPSVIAEQGNKCKILYSPLHGSGNMPVRRALDELGFKQVTVVPEQENPDPNFSTVKSPNPEEREAFTLALRLAEELEPDLIIATDPDADRIGVAVSDNNGQYQLLTGNQIGVLLTYYILSQLQASQKLPPHGVVVKTIVTTDMVLAIAKDFGVSVEQTLTGFKFIGEKIHEYEVTGDKTFIFGFEESYGYLAGTFVRDKDAVCAAVLLAEAVAFYKSQGKSLYQVLTGLWETYGYYQEALHTITLEGKSGTERMNFLLEQIRLNPPKEFSRYKVNCIEDYLAGTSLDLETGIKHKLSLPKADVMRFTLAQGGYVVFRPSGTEPKAKVYISLAGTNLEEAQESVNVVKASALDLVNYILKQHPTKVNL